MDNDRAYVIILRDSLVNKKKILLNLIDYTEKQAELVKQGDIEADEFEKLIDDKGKSIAMLNMVDDGFESIYSRVREEIQTEPDKYKAILQEIQSLIEETVSLGAKIETLEHRNKEMIEAFISGKRTEIKDFRSRKNTMKSYSQNMPNQHVQGSSYFLDKKN